MKSKSTVKGTIIAFAVAGFFGCGSKTETKPTNKTDNNAKPVDATKPDAATGEKVKCTGINECKGKGACHAADGSHSCAGKNDCKGKGWIEVPAADCTAKGGKVLAANEPPKSEPASTPAAATAEKVNCAGINECKAQGKCSAADGSHACAGKNECKGKGWIEATAADCTAKGGTVVAKK